ncbi:acetate--CoA ligase family protein [Motiliproteus sp. MSK22-1]|uniref:acetate--CoA ligase family protein n=1 Tax=Motiliproteus sp. MSK22-1 TaxID=1897630 RepID=UPI000976BB32|nr:acetate--CoA ligase family protein [Motiliproteus sp. MSK22-1]OMH29150.1 hypothetical protein BGP75_20610 [Motiliproteus sp. MSK22-1]
MNKQQRKNLQRMLLPRSVVFIGGRGLATAIKTCETIGYQGELFVVNPFYESIGGVSCYATLDDLPQIPDAALVAVNSNQTVAVVAELAKKGVGGCVCYAAGFAEVGGAGSELQRCLVEAAGDMALVGPNCYGVLNFVDGVTLWPSAFGGERVAHGAAVISQSGNIALNMTMLERSLPLAHVISVGNQAVLGIGDYIQALVEDNRVDCIGLYIEGLDDVPAFSRAAQYALEKGKPIIAIKVGVSEVAAKLTASHTSSLAGSDTFYDALFQRLGVIRVKSMTEMTETLKLFCCAAPLNGNRIGIMTCAGGDAALAADLANVCGLVLPDLSLTQTETLQEQLDDFVTVANPLDYNTAIWGNEAELTRCFRVMQADSFDATVLIIDCPPIGTQDEEDWDASIQALINTATTATNHSINNSLSSESGMLAVISTFPERLGSAVRQRLISAGIAPLQGLEEGIRALSYSAWYQQRRMDAMNQSFCHVALPDVNPAASNGRLMDEWQSKQQLSSYGLPVPQGQLLRSGDRPAITTLYPVALKAVSDQLVHKTELGAVILNLQATEAVTEAMAMMELTLTRQGKSCNCFLVEPMVTDPVAELIVGVQRDPQFGLALTLGSGGVLVNLIEDSVTLLLPTSRESVARALDRLKCKALMTGYRGKPPGDIEALLDAVMAVATYAIEHRQDLLELDINPLMVLPTGQGVIAVDAMIRTTQ